ncbi:nucleoside/nucleotide kinase family protein [Deinococcus aerophilus]|uniref:Nucleoside/nucleotide kinase family protein n=1 Tax=Deinococcus aerophilus TaxID=522488 RepID=A0ABQ2GSQ9_9DEIO|nr:nucleoside/nucleotide kinase family protein [Deinococcus aerophilus]GGM11572.1 nucleoside/nucleotide kinase family protein [Deinococcus aerophilus]
MTDPLSGPPVLRATTADLAARVQALAMPGGRTVLGLTGAPGAGKSTLCTALAGALGTQAAVVGMDGFHLANAELERLGRRDRKGAPDTFDAGGYAALLARLRAGGEDTVYAPAFDRTLEESIGSAVPVPAGTPLILTEGNYLLLEDPPWPEVRRQLDTVWFLEVPDEVRVPRLISRHVAFGKTSAQAEAWAAQVDGRNAARIQASRSRADLIVQWTG